ncbi:MAG TPA: hypothetical protein VJA23_05745 [Candidatus Nanoarchaeia archaeon]|nr:hypothetical protein [Candidatus Nanoarchaeia archaeon]
MDLDECYRKGFIRKTKVDKELIFSLIEMAGIKEIAVNTAKINEINISAYVSLAYDSLREILEALCISKGYKVTSHFCTGELLRTLVKDFEYNDFDRFRYIRNNINYYGTKINFEQGKELIQKTFSLKNRLIQDQLKEHALIKR